MSKDRIQRAIDRMAYQIAEDRGGGTNITIMGINERGFAVAKRLAYKLRKLSEGDVVLMQLKGGKGKAFDLKNKSQATVPAEIDYGILIDDVIFSGQTMLEAIKVISHRFDPSILRTAVLVDRGHRSLPVEASFTGMQLPTKLNEHVSVRLGNQGPGCVVLTKK